MFVTPGLVTSNSITVIINIYGYYHKYFSLTYYDKYLIQTNHISLNLHPYSHKPLPLNKHSPPRL